jgi:hypothetical protein
MIFEVTVLAAVVATVTTIFIIVFTLAKLPSDSKDNKSEGFCSIDKSDAVLSPIKVMSTDVYSLSTPDHVILI